MNGPTLITEPRPGPPLRSAMSARCWTACSTSCSRSCAASRARDCGRVSPFFPGRCRSRLETVPTGTQVFDWEVPPGGRLKRARLTGPDGVVYCDAARCNLEVVNYAMPVDCRLTLEELQPHLHSIPHLPEAVPYVTSLLQAYLGFFACPTRCGRICPKVFITRRSRATTRRAGLPFGQAVLKG